MFSIHLQLAEAPVIYTNPFVDNFTLDFYTQGVTTAKATISIYDLKGGLLYTQQLNNLMTGHNTVKVNLTGKNLPAATYMALLNINGVVTNTVKLLKTN